MGKKIGASKYEKIRRNTPIGLILNTQKDENNIHGGRHLLAGIRDPLQLGSDDVA